MENHQNETAGSTSGTESPRTEAREVKKFSILQHYKDHKLSTTIFVVGIALAAFATLCPCLSPSKDWGDRAANFGQTIGLLLTSIVVFLQVQELRLQRKDLKINQSAMELQRQELQLHRREMELQRGEMKLKQEEVAKQAQATQTLADNSTKQRDWEIGQEKQRKQDAEIEANSKNLLDLQLLVSETLYPLVKKFERWRKFIGSNNFRQVDRDKSNRWRSQFEEIKTSLRTLKEQHEALKIWEKKIPVSPEYIVKMKGIVRHADSHPEPPSTT